jgi:hypothetical protein
MLARVAGACACADVRLNACMGAQGHASVHQSAQQHASLCGWCDKAFRCLRVLLVHARVLMCGWTLAWVRWGTRVYNIVPSSMPLSVVGALQRCDACAFCWCMRVS